MYIHIPRMDYVQKKCEKKGKKKRKVHHHESKEYIYYSETPYDVDGKATLRVLSKPNDIGP